MILRRLYRLAHSVLTALLIVGLTLSVTPLPPAQAVKFTEFNVPTPNSAPRGITRGPDGNIWFTESLSNKIGRITPNGVITEFTVGGVAITSITTGPDGWLWYTRDSSGYIGRLNPATGAFTETFVDGGPTVIVAGPDGNLWFTKFNVHKIGRFNPTTGNLTDFPIRTGLNPNGITVGPDGNLWFAAQGSGHVGSITLGGIVSLFKLSGDKKPRQTTAGPDGKVWFTWYNSALSSGVGQITRSGQITTFTTGGDPYGITAGPDGVVWFARLYGGTVGRIHPQTGALAEYPTPSGGGPYWITGTPDGNLWFTEGNGNKIGRLALPTLSMSDAVTVTEGNIGATTAALTVTLSFASDFTTTVDYTALDGTATITDSDFPAATGVLTIPAGVTTRVITVAVNGDLAFEPDETFIIQLSNPVSGMLSPAQGRVTILDDDAHKLFLPIIRR